MVYDFQNWFRFFIRRNKTTFSFVSSAATGFDSSKKELFNEKRICLLRLLQERNRRLLLLENRFDRSFNPHSPINFSKLSAAEQDRFKSSQSALKEGLQEEVEHLTSVLDDMRKRRFTAWEESALLKIVYRHMERVEGVFVSYEEALYKFKIPRQPSIDAKLEACRKEFCKTQGEIKSKLLV